MRKRSVRSEAGAAVRDCCLRGLSVFAALAMAGCLFSAAGPPQEALRGHVMRWLQEYENAWNAGDAARLGRMLGLNSAEVGDLRKVFAERPELRVIVSNVAITRIDDETAQASYDRTDRWLDPPTGQPRYATARYEQTFRIVGGEVREISLRRR